MTKVQNSAIFAEIAETGYITEPQLRLIKNRSNKAQKDLFDYSLFEKLDKIKLTNEQGEKGLTYLRTFIDKENPTKAIEGAPIGCREIEAIAKATPCDFTFRGFYNIGTGSVAMFTPIYELTGFAYIVKDGKPFIIE